MTDSFGPNSPSVEFYHQDSRTVEWATLAPLVKCVITDPPYGVDHVSGFAATEKGKKFANPIEGDLTLNQALVLFNSVMGGMQVAFAEEVELYVFTNWKVLQPFIDSVNDLADVEVKNVLVWEKGWPGLGDLDGNWANSTELIIYAKKGRRPIPKRRPSVIAIDRLPSSKMIHPTQKPVELLQVLLEMSTDPGDLVVDPFGGSASTARACREMGRSCVSFEKDKLFFDRAQDLLSQRSLFG